MNPSEWDRVERRLDELKDVAPYRTTVAAMMRVLPKLRGELPDNPPHVSHASLSFPGPRGRGVSLDWDEEHEGYTVSLVLSDGSHAATKRVAEGRLADVIHAYLERCSQSTVSERVRRREQRPDRAGSMMGEFSEKETVSEDELAEEILSYLERCQPEPTPPSATPSPAPKTQQAKRQAPPKRPTPPTPPTRPKTKRAKRRAPPKR